MPDELAPGSPAADTPTGDAPADASDAAATPASAATVLDLRDEVPSRHRPTRGVPREPDRHLATYRDRAARPAHRHGRRPPLIEVDEVDEVAAHADRAGPAPERADEAPAPSTVDAPSTATAPPSGGGDREKRHVGELVVRRVRLRSVLKVSLAFHLCLFAVVMLAGAILWHLANEQGWVTGWTGFLVDIGFTDADVDGATLARASAITGGILVVTATLLTVAMACFYNEISGLLGGVAVTFGPRGHHRRHRR